MTTTPACISTGIKTLDNALGNLCLGDNIVWQLDKIDNLKEFLPPFCDSAIAEERKLIYFRFAKHSPLVTHPDAEIHEISPNNGFETFIFKVLNVIESSGEGNYYVFDSLSYLAHAWSCDRMLANFFILTCPYLRKGLNIAHFPLLRNKHAKLWALNAIHHTAQVIINIYNSQGSLYTHPIKVQGRYSPNLFMLHCKNGDDFNPVMKSTVVSEIFSDVVQPWLNFNIDQPGIWTATFIRAEKILKRIRRGKALEHDIDEMRKKLIRMIIGREESVFDLYMEYFELDELVRIAKRIVGTGLIGGKAVGMLLARAIIKNKDPKWNKLLETHDSFFIGADVFYTYVIENDCWWLAREMKKSDHKLDKAEVIRKKILEGHFPEDIEARFKEILNYYGQSPIIVRSSSLLEDAYGNAFSGKYDSVFCANQGTPAERLQHFKDAVREVFASVVSVDAIEYRQHKGLMQKEEQMAILVQRVSGENFGSLYFPHLAGVGYSFNPFVWNPKIDPSTGVLRLVFGLGTRAVDQHGDDYTRVVAINEPLLRPDASSDEVRKHTQRVIDIIDIKENSQHNARFEDVIKQTSDKLPLEVFASKDRELISRAKQYGMKGIFPWALTFDKLFKETDFVKNMGEILAHIGKAYKHPVDIEFTANFISPTEYRINIVQCRPFHFNGTLKSLKPPKNVNPDHILLKTTGPILGQSKYDRIDKIIYVHPNRYSTLTMPKRHQLARLVGDLTNAVDPEENVMLMGPGRWGTSMPSLGIPVSFPEIRNAAILCEIVAMHEGLTPDISLGTHFFNDLVEMEILYFGLNPADKGNHINTEMLLSTPNRILELKPEAGEWADTIHVLDTNDLNENKKGYVFVDTLKQKGMIFIDKEVSHK